MNLAHDFSFFFSLLQVFVCTKIVLIVVTFFSFVVSLKNSSPGLIDTQVKYTKTLFAHGLLFQLQQHSIVFSLYKIRRLSIFESYFQQSGSLKEHLAELELKAFRQFMRQGFAQDRVTEHKENQEVKYYHRYMVRLTIS